MLGRKNFVGGFQTPPRAPAGATAGATAGINRGRKAHRIATVWFLILPSFRETRTSQAPLTPPPPSLRGVQLWTGCLPALVFSLRLLSFAGLVVFPLCCVSRSWKPLFLPPAPSSSQAPAPPSSVIRGVRSRRFVCKVEIRVFVGVGSPGFRRFAGCGWAIRRGICDFSANVFLAGFSVEDGWSSEVVALLHL